MHVSSWQRHCGAKAAHMEYDHTVHVPTYQGSSKIAILINARKFLAVDTVVVAQSSSLSSIFAKRFTRGHCIRCWSGCTGVIRVERACRCSYRSVPCADSQPHSALPSSYCSTHHLWRSDHQQSGRHRSRAGPRSSSQKPYRHFHR